MELGVRQFRWHEQFHALPRDSMDFGVRQFCLHEHFHGIPWHLECTNFHDTSSSMEFHGTSIGPISLTRAVPWNSMQLWVRQFRWHKQFHEIPWYFECANFDDEQFRGIPWNSMQPGERQFRWHEQFHGIPWNSMELGMRQFRWHEQYHYLGQKVFVHLYRLYDEIYGR